MWHYPPERILVPVDFGEASAQAVRVAGAMAGRYGARLTALHAESLEAPPYFTHEQIEKLERQRIDARTRASRYLEEFAGRLTGAPLGPRLSEQPPVEAILDAATSHDLVVMGTHGRRGASYWWLGSVAERVVRGAHCPVLVVRAAEGDARGEAAFQRILVAGSPEASPGSTAPYAHGLSETFSGRLLESLPVCRETDAERVGATLLVMPRPTHSTGWLGDTPERLIRGCRLPMLFVPEESREIQVET